MSNRSGHIFHSSTDRPRACVFTRYVGASEAGFSEAEANLLAAKANLEIAALNLDSARIASPINGKIGRANITPGNVVQAHKSVLATIVSIDPMMAVYFDVDERTVLRNQMMRLARHAKAPQASPVLLLLANGEYWQHRGAVDSAEVRINPATGTLRFFAVFPNPEGILLPGLSARIRLETRVPHSALLVAEQAVRMDKGQASVFVVHDKNIIERHAVTLGLRYDGLRVVSQGLQATDWVVVDNFDGLSIGMAASAKRLAMPSLTAPPAP